MSDQREPRAVEGWPLAGAPPLVWESIQNFLAAQYNATKSQAELGQAATELAAAVAIHAGGGSIGGREDQIRTQTAITIRGILEALARPKGSTDLSGGVYDRDAHGGPGPGYSYLARQIHTAWREGMIHQGRDVAEERMEWPTLPQREKELDQFIADWLLSYFLAALSEKGWG
jgi:hypothetical protein